MSISFRVGKTTQTKCLNVKQVNKWYLSYSEYLLILEINKCLTSKLTELTKIKITIAIRINTRYQIVRSWYKTPQIHLKTAQDRNASDSWKKVAKRSITEF